MKIPDWIILLPLVIWALLVAALKTLWILTRLAWAGRMPQDLRRRPGR